MSAIVRVFPLHAARAPLFRGLVSGGRGRGRGGVGVFMTGAKAKPALIACTASGNHWQRSQVEGSDLTAGGPASIGCQSVVCVKLRYCRAADRMCLLAAAARADLNELNELYNLYGLVV